MNQPTNQPTNPSSLPLFSVQFIIVHTCLVPARLDELARVHGAQAEEARLAEDRRELERAEKADLGHHRGGERQ